MALKLKTLALDIWLLEQLREAPAPGLTLEELQRRWKSNPQHTGLLGRSTLTRHRQMLKENFDIVVHTPDKKHYSLANPEKLALDSLANELLASVQEYLFLDDYRDLGDALQPQQIWAGMEYLHAIGDAIRQHRKLRVRYQKFSDDRPYEAILHPYCLKACQGRWYLLAVKEGSEHPVQTFALDRTLSLHMTRDTFCPDDRLDVRNYFRDAFGVWVDTEHYPARDITVAVTPQVAQYWRTLPLHHSQQSLGQQDGECLFRFHIAPTPDFLGELRRWEAREVKDEG